MKTHVGMKNGFFEFIEELGPLFSYVVNGVVGGAVWSIYKKSKFWEAVRQIVIGGTISGYLTPVIVSKTSMSLELVGCTSFVIGMMGMVIIDSVYKYFYKKIKTWKEASSIIIKQK